MASTVYETEISVGVIIFSLTLKVKISVQGHFIDNSNEHKFLYVLSSSSSEKNYIFRQALGFYFLGSHVTNCRDNVIKRDRRVCIQCDKLL